MENIEIELNKALKLIEDDEFMEARALLYNIVGKCDNIEAYKNLGLCEVNLDNPIAAIKAFKKVTELDKDDITSIFYLASCYNKTGQKEFAIDNFKKVIEFRPNYIDAYVNLAMIYIEFNQVDAAIDTILKLIENSDVELDYAPYYILSTAYMIKKDTKNAVKYLEIAHKLNPTHLQIANALIVSYINTNNFAPVKDLLDETYNYDNNFNLTIYNYGVYYQTLGQFDRALEYFKKAYENEPTVSMLSTLASCALKAEEGQLAKMLYNNLSSAYPNNVEYRLSYLDALELCADFEEALKNIDILLKNDERNVDYLKKKAIYLRKLSSFEESINVLNGLLNRGKVDVEIYYNLAFDYVLSLDFDNAKEMFKKCLQLEPNNPYVHKDLGVLYLKMNLYDWALDEIKTAVKLEEDVSEFHYSLGVTYMMLSDIENAKKSLENAIKYDNKNVDAIAYYGYIYLMENNFEMAFNILQKAIEIDSKNFLARLHLAKYYFAVEKYEIAKQLLLDIVSDTKDDETMNMLAICYMETGDFESASGIFSKLVVEFSDNHILLTNLAKCELKIGKKEEALEHIRKALFVFNDYEEALAILEEIKADGK